MHGQVGAIGTTAPHRTSTTAASDPDHTVGADAPVPVTEQADLVPAQAKAVIGVEDDEKVVPRPFVLGEMHEMHHSILAGHRRRPCAPRA